MTLRIDWGRPKTRPLFILCSFDSYIDKEPSPLRGEGMGEGGLMNDPQKTSILLLLLSDNFYFKFLF